MSQHACVISLHKISISYAAALILDSEHIGVFLRMLFSICIICKYNLNAYSEGVLKTMTDVYIIFLQTEFSYVLQLA